MDKKEILEFIAKNPMAALGTVEDNKARVRGMETFRVDENGLIFYTGKHKDVFKQIAKNPEVEACYFVGGNQVRVRGKMEILEDEALKMEIVEKRSFLKQVYQGNYEGMAVCRLKGKATTWSIQDMAAPKTFIDL
jgi:pyridoxamine 5'-phosphate oxidase